MLLIGVAGTGKTHRVLEELAAALAAGRHATLVVPTASMAEHLQHQLTRQGLLISPRAILPLTRFVEGFTPDCKELSRALQLLFLEQALRRTAPAEFGSVSGYPGFQARLLETIEEIWSAGGEAPPNTAFAQVMAEFESLLRAADAVDRAERLRRAAAAIRKQKLGAVFFDGFFNFTPVELELLRSVAQSAQKILVTLPDTGTDEARRALGAVGLRETRLDCIHRPRPAPVALEAPSPEREIEDVAARILADHRATGRPFQEYGIILRNPEHYGPIVETVLERFGIPFRSRQPKPLDSHSAIRLLVGLLRLAATEFDGAEALELMKLAGSGIGLDPDMDRFEFELREKLPGNGLEFLRRQAAEFPRVAPWIRQLEDLAPWAADRAAPQTWARRAAGLAAAWFHPPQIEDGVPHSQVLEWKGIATALEAWSHATEEAAEALRLAGAANASLAEYLASLEAVLRLTPLRISDRRRNVVQVLTVYEARQWELPVVFVCGLVEKEFPRYHSQNLFFPDAEQRRLEARGLRLRTSAERDAEERFLFDLAITRATTQLYLTYPARDETGGETLRSFFLEGFEIQPAQRVRLKETAPEWRPAPAFLADPGLRPALAARHERFSPSALDQYLQCPFLFFAERTLRLQQPPVEPEDRIDEALKGTIIHRTIARWAVAGAGGPIRPVFEQVFAEECEQAGIRLNFRAESMKVQLLLDLERFAEEESARGALAGFRAAGPESQFEYIVEEGGEAPFRVTGRIDRYEVSDAGAAVVVDYKYSTRQRVRRLIEDHERGWRLQAPLYLLGLERRFGLAPAGMILYGLRKETCRGGWYVSGSGGMPPQPDLIEKTPREFRNMLESAAARTLEVVEEIRRGRVEVAPRDRQVCRRFCRYRAVCRVEV